MKIVIIGNNKFEDFVYIKFLHNILTPVIENHSLSLLVILLNSEDQETPILPENNAIELVKLGHRNYLRFYSQFKSQQYDAIIDFSGELFGPLLCLKKKRPLLFSTASIRSVLGLHPKSTSLAKMPDLKVFISEVTLAIGEKLDLSHKFYSIDQSTVEEEIKLINWSLNTTLDLLNTNYILIYYHMRSSQWQELEQLIERIKSTFNIKILVLLEQVSESDIHIKRKQSRILISKDVFINSIAISNFNHVSLALWKAQFVISNKKSFCMASSYFDQQVFFMSKKNHFGVIQNTFRKAYISKIVSEIRIDELIFILKKKLLFK